tara:strand:- start:221 stop:1564 length:1344 start_codon:yes stop_codon:yes gene_type:complete
MTLKNFSLIISKPIKNYNKSIFIDSDKSISIRSFLIASISEGISLVENPLESEDVKSTLEVVKKLGIKIKKISSKKYKVYGKGLGSLQCRNNSSLNFGNSGTLARLIIGILSTTPDIKVKIKGDKSLNKRSMAEVIKLMNQFGAEFFPKNKFHFPLILNSSNYPISISYNSGKSAQLKSAVILAGLNANGQTLINENEISRDHTENILIRNKNSFKILKKKVRKIIVNGKKALKSFSIKIPGDPSSAAFFVALTILRNNSKIRIKNVCLNPSRIGFYELLKKSGAKIKLTNLKKINNEIVGDILAESSSLKPIKATKDYYVKATDEFPILFIISALTKGVSIYKGLGGLKNKESDRVEEMRKILKQVGIKTEFKNNNVKIFGEYFLKKKNKIIKVPNLGDHRICMSTVIFSLVTGVICNIKNFETVFTSSPNFLKNIKLIGAKFEKY